MRFLLHWSMKCIRQHGHEYFRTLLVLQPDMPCTRWRVDYLLVKWVYLLMETTKHFWNENHFFRSVFSWKKTVKMIWIVAVLTVICFHQPLIKSDISYITASTFLTIMRVLYPASISWMVLAGRGYFAKILNHPIFVHINKLSYGIYLLNPVVIYALYGWQDHSTHISPISMVCTFHHVKFQMFNRSPVISVCALLGANDNWNKCLGLLDGRGVFPHVWNTIHEYFV